MLSTIEQADFSTAVRALMETYSSSVSRRRIIESGQGHDPDAWRAMAAMGLLGIGTTELVGGSGGGVTELCIVMEESGRALLPTPYYSTVAAATTILAQLQSDTAIDMIGAIASGELLVAVAFGTACADLMVTGSAGSLSVRGQIRGVPDALTAQTIVLEVSLPDGRPAIVRVNPHGRGCVAVSVDATDATRPLADLTLSDAPIEILADGAKVLYVLSRTRSILSLAAAAEAVGATQAALAMTIEHVQARNVFGRRLSSFQAVKHRLADAKVGSDTAQSLVHRVAREWDTTSADATALDIATDIAAAHATQVFSQVTAAMLQLLGGMSFTWEHDAHLYYKRSIAAKYLLDAPTCRLDRIARVLIDDAATSKELLFPGRKLKYEGKSHPWLTN